MAAGTAAPPRSPTGEKQAEKFLGRSQLNADAPGLPLPLYGLPLRPSGDTSSPASGTNKVRLSFMLCSIPTSEMGSLQNRKVLFYSRGTNLKDPRIQTPKSRSSEGSCSENRRQLDLRMKWTTSRLLPKGK